MKNIKKILLIIINCTLAICMIILFVGCGGKGSEEQGKPQKYDVAIKVACKEVGNDGQLTGPILDIITFPIGTDEITLERKYTNREIAYYVYQYNLPNHPYMSEYWVVPSSEGANVFSKTIIYKDINGNSVAGIRNVKDSGIYEMCFEARATSNLWNYRCVYLNISVTKEI